MSEILIEFDETGASPTLEAIRAVERSVDSLKRKAREPIGVKFGPATGQDHLGSVMRQISDLRKLASTPVQSTLFKNLAGEDFTKSLTPSVMNARAQLKQFNQEMQEGTEKSKNFGFQLGFLGRLIVAMGVRKVVHDVVELTDAYASFENKLRVVVPSAERLKIAQEDLVKIAIDSRTPLEETGILFSRITQATAALGKTQTQVTQFTSTMTKAIQVSGATSNEAKNAIVQLSQGMALGTLRGQDLKSVLEFLPYVSQLIADKMGVAVGQLKSLGAAGKITTDTVFQGIIESTKEVEAKFALLKPRVSEMFEVLKTKYTVALGEAGTIQDVMVTGLKFLAEHFDTVLRSVLALTAGITALWFGNAMMGFVAFLAANPFTLFIGGLAAATIALVTFGDQIHVPGDELLSLQDIALGSMNQIGNTLKDQASLAEATSNSFLDLWQAAAGKGKGTDWTMEAAKAMDLLRVLANPEWLVMEPLAALGVLGDDLGGQVVKDVNATQIALQDIRKGKTEQNKVDSTKKVNDELARWRMGLQDSAAKGVTPPSVTKQHKESGQTFEQLINEATFKQETADDDDDITRRIETKLHAALEKLKPSIKKWGFDLNQEMAKAEAEYSKKVKNNIDDWDPEKENSLNTMVELNDKALEQFNAKKKSLQQQSGEYQKQVDMLREQIALTELHIATRKKQIEDEKAANKLLDERLKKMLEEEKRQENIRKEHQQFLANNVQGKQETNIGIAEGLNPGIGTMRKINELEQFALVYKDFPEWAEAAKNAADELRDSLMLSGANLIFMEQFKSTWGVGGTMVQGFSDLAAKVLVFNLSLKEAKNMLRDLATTLESQALSSLFQLGLNSAIGAIGSSLGPQGTLPGGLRGPDGKATHIDVVGTSSPYKNQLPGLPGHAEGGYTGNYGTSQVAGYVHGQEFVLNSDATRKYRPMLEAMNKGGTIAAGGGTQASVTVHNYAGVQVETGVTEGDVQIMISKAIQERTPAIVSQAINNPNSPVSRALNKNLSTDRRRT